MMFNLTNLSSQNKIYLAVALIWSFAWKGVALWKAANKKHKWWFIAIFIVNTLAVLEIAYIFYFSKLKKEKTQEQEM